MKPYYQDEWVTQYCKSCYPKMDELPDESVQCVVTSPPYWGLRKYSGEQDLIWGDENCKHEWFDSSIPKSGGVGDYEVGRVGNAKARSDSHDKKESATCSLCGSWKGSYGLEPTPEMYVQHTIEILREIRRVLRKDGVVFWNIGDSYGGSGKGGSKGDNSRKQLTNAGSVTIADGETNYVGGVIKPKDLCLIPFRVAIAAQEDGWWVRSVIIWSKPNPMPESVTDRPTESHEYLLMLTKSGKSLYWTHRDGKGTREKPKADYRWVNQLSQEEVAVEPTNWEVKIKCPECEGKGEVSVHLGLDVWQDTKCPICNGKKETQLWKRINLWKGHDYYWDADAVREPQSEGTFERYGKNPNIPTKKKWLGVEGESHVAIQEHIEKQGSPMQAILPNGRNIRSVWEFPTQPYPEAHFAVFPEKLPETCIKAATPEVGRCSKCGAPWERITETSPMVIRRSNRRNEMGMNYATGTPASGTMLKPAESKTLGWQPTCECNADKVPSKVLDPFAGAGTTLWKAKTLNRRAVGFDTSGEYCELIVERCRQSVMDFGV